MMGKFKGFTVKTVAVLIFALLIALFSVTITAQTDKDIAEDSEIALILSLASSGDTEYARQLLKDMRENRLDSVEMTLCDAYISAAEGNSRATAALLNKVAVLDAKSLDKKLLSLAKDAIGLKDYSSVEALTEYAKKVLERKLDGQKRVKKVAMVLADADKVYDDYLRYNNYDKEAIEEILDELEDTIEKDPSFLDVPAVSLCRLKLLALVQDFRGIVRSISSKSSFEELAVAAELYMGGLVKDSNFEESYIGNYKEMCEKVVAQLEKVYDKIPNEKETLLKRVDTLIKSVENSSDYPAINKLKDDISVMARDEAFDDRSKAYIQLARIELQNGNDELAESSITQALGTVGACNDEEFTAPVHKIVDVITNKDNPEKLKDVVSYVDDIIENTSDEVIAEVVNSTAADNTESQENQDGQDFSSFMTDYVSRKRISLNFTSVNVEAFPEIKATLNVDESLSLTAKELSEAITLSDCFADIENFKVEKVDAKKANILLLCDVSGSMSGSPISDLRNAVTLFAENATSIEKISLVTFSSDIEMNLPFGTSNEEIAEAGSSLVASGGTNMALSLVEVIDSFEYKSDEMNYVILLSDGEDGYAMSDSEIETRIGLACQSRGIVVYSLGLGSSSNSSYMSKIATSTGGDFVYVNDSATLTNFYQRLKSQILNRYIITFTAKDTLTVDNRCLKVTFNDDSLSYDEYYYSLRGEEEDKELTEDETNLVTLKDRGISGFDVKRIYRSTEETKINLKGYGFEKQDNVTIELSGALKYALTQNDIEYIDKNTFSVTLPASMACGIYDAKITINGKSAFLAKELTVSVQGEDKRVAFGPYVFSASSVTTDGNKTLLSGNVVLNGWLNFIGEVELYGDLNSNSIRMSDYYGSYIRYTTDSAKGLAKMFYAKNSRAMQVPALGTFDLYNDISHLPDDDKYLTDDILLYAGGLYITDIFTLNAPGLHLYPNKISFETDTFNTRFPFQDTLLKATGMDDLFSFEISLGGDFTPDEIDFSGEFKNESASESYMPVNFGSMPIYILPASFELSFDTGSNEYKIKASTKVAFIDSEGLSFEIKWSGGESKSGLWKLVPSKVGIGSDFSIKSTIGTLPVTYSDFKLFADKINTTNIWKTRLGGSFDLSTVKVSSYLPGIEKYFSDPALFQLDDTTIQFSLGDLYIGVETTFKLLEEIQLGKVNIEAGNFEYTSVILGMDSVDAAGLQADIQVGVVWETDNCDIDLSATGRFSVHSRLIGIEATATGHVQLQWWILHPKSAVDGQVVLGFMPSANGGTFILKTRSSDPGIFNPDREKEVYVTWSVGQGLDHGTTKL